MFHLSHFSLSILLKFEIIHVISNALKDIIDTDSIDLHFTKITKF